MEQKNDIFEIIETERLILKPLSLRYTDQVYEHFSDDDVTIYMDIESLTDIKQAENIINAYAKKGKEQDKFRWAIIRKKDLAFIGTCGFNNWIKQRGNRSEIGYDLSKKYWGNGYMSEALKIMIDHGFKNMVLRRIEATVTKGNDNSRNVLKKLGFKEEGLLRQHSFWKNQFVDLYMYSMLNDEWRNYRK